MSVGLGTAGFGVRVGRGYRRVLFHVGGMGWIRWSSDMVRLLMRQMTSGNRKFGLQLLVVLLHLLLRAIVTVPGLVP